MMIMRTTYFMLIGLVVLGVSALNAQNVGIGTTNPIDQLDVNGHARLNYTLHVDASGSTGFVASKVNLYSHDDYRGAGIYSLGQSFDWFWGNPYTDHDDAFILSRAVAGTGEGTAQKSNALLFVSGDGKVGIGTIAPTEQLQVEGNAVVVGVLSCRKIKVTTTGFPDYVFDDDYDLKSLSEVEEFINKNKHLPGVPSEKEVIAEGMDLKELTIVQQEKIEELFLHLIAAEKKMKQMEEEIQKLKEN